MNGQLLLKISGEDGNTAYIFNKVLSSTDSHTNTQTMYHGLYCSIDMDHLKIERKLCYIQQKSISQLTYFKCSIPLNEYAKATSPTPVQQLLMSYFGEDLLNDLRQIANQPAQYFKE